MSKDTDDIVANIGAVFLVAYIMMLVIGGVHHSIYAPFPALGYFATLAGIIVLNFVIYVLRRVLR